MNFLAHLYLADPTPDSIIGNLVADFIKGPTVSALPAGVQRGIRQHRRVDAFTDYHPLVQRSISRISTRWDWFSAILIDVYYDHLLALNWASYSTETLRRFTDRIHQCLSEHAGLVPLERENLYGLIASDRLFTYGSLEGIEEALQLLSRRIEERMPNRPVRLEEAMPDFLANHAGLLVDFREFFPLLIAFVRNQKWDGE